MGMISAVITLEDGTILVHESKTKHVDTIFQPNFYETWTDRNGVRHIKIKPVNEIHEPFVTKQNLSAIDTINAFFKDGMLDKVNTLGFTHKLGVLLHGKQGTGKTSLINYIITTMVEKKNAVVFFCNDGNRLGTAIALAKEVRAIQDSPIIFVADEFERYAKDYEAEMKNLLDGNDSINNSLFLAATNYIDKVPNTLKDRPSRFRVVLEITGVDDKPLIKKMIKKISDKATPPLFTKKEIDEIVDAQKSMTLDEIKHVCLSKVTNLMLPAKFSTPIGLVNGLTSGELDSIEQQAAELVEDLMDFAIEHDIKLEDVMDKLRKEINSDIAKGVITPIDYDSESTESSME